ncbi:hypothetical protein SteCoe_22390 [Stentor coeruleus]|uniref:Uncharacterized protein n=1 Tax=Stentor coeruleus TaxID=5963 RepID=A0A1R2BMW9_9CILI|nr:hypothetical protein SteCoe_22390 [Stentor coeruleus]
MGMSEEIRNDIRLAKSMIESNLITKAKDTLYQCIKRTQKLILETHSSNTSLLQVFAQLLNKSYKSMARIEKKQRHYTESIEWYQKAYNSAKKADATPDLATKTFRELQDTISFYTTKIKSSKSPIRIRPSPNQQRLYQKNCQKITTSSSCKRQETLKHRDDFVNMRIYATPMKEKSEITTKKNKIKTKSKLSNGEKGIALGINEKISKIFNSFHLKNKKPQKNIEKSDQSEKKSTEIFQESEIQLKSPDLTLKVPKSMNFSLETGIKLGVLNTKAEKKNVSNKLEEEKAIIVRKVCAEAADFLSKRLESRTNALGFIVKSSKILMNSIETNILYYLNQNYTKITIICKQNNKKYTLTLPFNQDQGSISEYIDKKIENYLLIVDDKLEIVPISSKTIAKGFVVDEISYTVSICEEYPREKYCVSGTFMKTFLEKHDKSEAKNQFLQVFTKLPQRKNPMQAFSCVFVNEKHQISVNSLENWRKIFHISEFSYNNLPVTAKISELSFENSFYYILSISNFPYIRLPKHIISNNFWNPSSNSCNHILLLNSIHFSDNFTDFYLELPQIIKKIPSILEKSPEETLQISVNSGSIIKNLQSGSPKAQDKDGFNKKHLKSLIKLQRKFKKYLIDDKNKLQINEYNGVILSTKIQDFEVNVLAKNDACLVQMANVEKHFYLYINHFMFLYVKKLVDSIIIEYSTATGKIGTKIFNFSKGIFDQIGDGRIIYRDCKLVNRDLHQICCYYYTSGLLEFSVTNKLGHESKFRIDIQTLSSSLGLDSQYLYGMVKFAVKNLLIIKEPDIIYLDLGRKYTTLDSVIKIQAFFRGRSIRKTIPRVTMNAIYKNYLMLKKKKYAILLILKDKIIMLRAIRGCEVWGKNLSKIALDREGLLTNIDYFFHNFIKIGMSKNQDEKIVFNGLDKYASTDDVYKYR